MIERRQTTENTFRDWSFIRVFYLRAVYEKIPSWSCLDWLRNLIFTIFQIEQQDFQLAKQVERKLNRSQDFVFILKNAHTATLNAQTGMTQNQRLLSKFQRN
jgi:hypothetical protein